MWTKEQQEAIYKRNTNIIVSAGAGSGKTAVLSERILELVKEGTSVKDLLVLTFTKAAALEMKERIYKRLKEEGFVKEANLVFQANITTFDAYALEIVKKYSFLLHLNKDLSIVDESVLKEEKRRIIEELFTKFYEENNERFYNLLRHYSAKDDKLVIELILKLNQKLDLLPDSKTFLANYEENYLTTTYYLSLAKEYEKIVLRDLEDIINNLEKHYSDSLANLKYSSKILDIINLLKECNCYEDVYEAFVTIKLPTIPRDLKEDVKNDKKSISDSIKEFKNNYLKAYKNKEEMTFELASLKEDILFLIEVSKEVYNKIDAYKAKLNVYSFTDIAKMLIKLVKEEKIVKDYFKTIKEILVDEYQDTSDLQEEFLKNASHDNLYMVGDLKQSIYRFRNANPYIFKEKYDKYNLNDGGYKIDLVKNFRSRKEVLQDINFIFNALMTPFVGDCDYEESHQMKYGLSLYDDYVDSNNYHLRNISYDYENTKYEDYKKEEIEAFITVKVVKDLLNRKTYDKNLKCLRPTTYKDIVILVDRSANFTLFKEIFTANNIPFYIDNDLDLKTSNFSLALISLLKVACFYLNNVDLDDVYYKRYIVSLLRSFIYQFTDEEIYLYLEGKKECSIFSKLALIDFNMSSLDIYFKILEVFEIYQKLPLIGNVRQATLEINSLKELFVSYDSLGYDFSEIVLRLALSFESEEKLKYKLPNNDLDQVRIMSIHHSKGLEYPYCIFPLLYPSFNMQDIKESMGYDNDFGIFLPYFKDGLKDTILKPLIKEKEIKKEISEKVRLFYVALTRAKEQMILIHPQVKKEVNKAHKIRSFLDMLNYIGFLNYNYENIDKSDIALTKDYNLSKSGTINFGKELLSYDVLNYSLAEIKKGSISKSVNKILTKEEKNLLEIGTNMHLILESLDLNNLDLSSLNLTSFYRKKLEKVFDLDIFNNLKEAKTYQELEFYFEENGTSYNGVIDLLLEFKDKFLIIDYKLANLDKSEYERQLNVYKRYIETKSKKMVKCYLLSVLNGTYKEVI